MFDNPAEPLREIGYLTGLHLGAEFCVVLLEATFHLAQLRLQRHLDTLAAISRARVDQGQGAGMETLDARDLAGGSHRDRRVGRPAVGERQEALAVAGVEDVVLETLSSRVGLYTAVNYIKDNIPQ